MFVKLDENNIVIQKQPSIQDFETGFIEAPDDVVCGQYLGEDGGYHNPSSAINVPENETLLTSE